MDVVSVPGVNDMSPGSILIPVHLSTRLEEATPMTDYQIHKGHMNLGSDSKGMP
jgi:hypothetical protein